MKNIKIIIESEEKVPDKWLKHLVALAVEFPPDSKEKDLDDDLDYYSLTIGWAIARGLSRKDASAFATFIRYQTKLM